MKTNRDLPGLPGRPGAAAMSETYVVSAFGKRVEISSTAVSPDKAMSRPALVWQARYADPPRGISPQARGYGLSAAEAVLDMLRASRASGTEPL